MKFKYLSDVVTLKLDQGKCNGCGMCLTVCPQGVFSMNNKVSAIADRDACLECGACAKNCPQKALSVRAGVGCAYAVLMDKFNLKGSCCDDTCECSLDDIKDAGNT